MSSSFVIIKQRSLIKVVATSKTQFWTIEGTLDDGQLVDLYNGGRPMRQLMAPLRQVPLYRTTSSARWRRVLVEIGGDAKIAENYARWLCK